MKQRIINHQNNKIFTYLKKNLRNFIYFNYFFKYVSYISLSVYLINSDLKKC